MRITIVTEIPAPFRIPLFNALAARDEVSLNVLFLSERDPRRAYAVHEDEMSFTHRYLRARHIHRGGRWVALTHGLGRELRRAEADLVIVGGWNQPAFWHVLARTRARGGSAALWVESTASDSRLPGRAAMAARRLAISLATWFVVPGVASASYLEELGVGANQIEVAPNAVDLTIFGERVRTLRGRRDELRRELSLTLPTFLYVGRLAPEKGIDVLLGAARELPIEVVVVGSGPLEQELRAAAPVNVRFAGQVPRDELPRWYAAADVFVLPSRSEPWGMVLNEAAAAGLPLIATDAVGAAWDLVEPGDNGYRVPSGDAAALREAITALGSDAELRERTGRRSLEVAARFTPEAWADAILRLARRG